MIGLTTVHLELTSRCNKNCWMCGRRKIDKDYPFIKQAYGDMNFYLLEKIANQLPVGITVQLHNNGEPTLYPKLGKAIDLFHKQFTQFNTNGKLLLEKSDEIIGNLDSLCISVIENDDEEERQYNIVKEFLEIKKNLKPIVVFRLLGNVGKFKNIDLDEFDYNNEVIARKQRWYHLADKHNCIIAHRTLHDPMGSRGYKKDPTVPEIGVCLEIASHMAINRFGEVSICVRFDPERKGIIGDANTTPLGLIWKSEKRWEWFKLHREGKRDKIPLCSKCEFWGVPTGS